MPYVFPWLILPDLQGSEKRFFPLVNIYIYHAVSAILVWIKSRNTQNTTILEQFLVLIIVIQVLLVKLINASLHKTKLA